MLSSSSVAIALSLGAACSGAGRQGPAAASSPDPADPSARPAGSGWYCTKSSKSTNYQPCYRSQTDCDAHVTSNPVVFAPCVSVATAHCFTTQTAKLGDTYGETCPPIEGWGELEFKCRHEEAACQGERFNANKRSRYSTKGRSGPNEACLVKKISACTPWN